MKIHYNDYNGFNLSSKTLRTARKRMFNCGEFYKFHLLIDAELETNSDYTEIEKSKHNFSLFADSRVKLEDNYLITAYNWGNENIYMHSLRRARACKRESNKMSSISKIAYYKEFNDLIIPRYTYFNSKREPLEA